MVIAQMFVAFVLGALSMLGVGVVAGESLVADAEQSVAAAQQNLLGAVGSVLGLFGQLFQDATQLR